MSHPDATAGDAALACSGLTLAAGGRTLVRDLRFGIAAGQRLCVLGRNGSGKTTLLHTLAGLRPAVAGSVLLDGAAIGAVPRRSLARRLGLVAQTSEDPFPATVLDMALIGRHPHLSFWEWEGEADRRAAMAALADVGLAGMADRRIDTLSGGERRRLAIATALCQDPRVLLLDEPLNHLDPQHQIEAMALFRQRADTGAAVVASLHDVNIAARFADLALLLFGPAEDGAWQYGPAREVLRPEPLSRLYRADVRTVADGDRQVFVTG